MGKQPCTRWKRWLWLPLAALACGCGSKDTERLGRVWQTTAGKFEALTGTPRGKLSTGWHAVRGALSDNTLDSRVATRLRWDRSLSDSQIYIRKAGPGVIRLEGTVADAVQQQRALDLARWTVGVEQVVDNLTIQKR
jgi:osmotically-inducible protein OsmY